MSENLIKMRPAITKLEVGESKDFPIERLKSVRTQASELGVILNRKFRTVSNREARTVTVTRIE